MKQNETVKPFEFLLKINDNIICQRYFNVKNFNKDSRESLEMKDMMDDIMGMNDMIQLGIIPQFFKDDCMKSTWELYNPHYYQSRKLYAKNIFDKQDIFKFEVLMHKECIAQGTFDGSYFQSGVRRNIDIREIIPAIIGTIESYLTLKSYTKVYADVELKRHNEYFTN